MRKRDLHRDPCRTAAELFWPPQRAYPEDPEGGPGGEGPAGAIRRAPRMVQGASGGGCRGGDAAAGRPDRQPRKGRLHRLGWGVRRR